MVGGPTVNMFAILFPLQFVQLVANTVHVRQMGWQVGHNLLDQFSYVPSGHRQLEVIRLPRQRIHLLAWPRQVAH